MPYKDKEKQTLYDRSRREKRKQYWKDYRAKKQGDKFYSTKDPEVRRLCVEIGKSGEKKAKELLKGSKHIKGLIDFSWEGKKVEVKTSMMRRHRLRRYRDGGWFLSNKYHWRFNLAKQKGKTDLFLLLCQDEEGNLHRAYLIPDEDLTVSQLNLAESRLPNYEKYRITL
jgi:hypothetical protein